ncbi:hypothetical protein L9F63_002559, partial [Diploptera punctata]
KFTVHVEESVANLSLSPKRFSLSRDSSNEGRATGSSTTVTSGPSGLHGFPKVVPPPGTVTPPHSRSLSTRRRTLECPSAPNLVLPPGAGPPRRLGSFRKNTQQQQQQATTPGSAGRQHLMFCRRRQSWPEVDQQATSGVHHLKYLFVLPLRHRGKPKLELATHDVYDRYEGIPRQQ